MSIEKQMAEDATGCRQSNGIGKFYNNKGYEITIKEAKKMFRQGDIIEVPNAGAGSYREVLNLLGFKKVEVYDWTSSAGDWTFKIRGKLVCQENRYPYQGFRYGISFEVEK